MFSSSQKESSTESSADSHLKVCLLALDLSLLAVKCGSTGKEELSLGIFVALNTLELTVQNGIKGCIRESNIPLLEKG